MPGGEYLIFLDDDDLFLPGVLTLQESIMRQHPEVAFVSGGRYRNIPPGYG